MRKQKEPYPLKELLQAAERCGQDAIMLASKNPPPHHALIEYIRDLASESFRKGCIFAWSSETIEAEIARLKALRNSCVTKTGRIRDRNLYVQSRDQFIALEMFLDALPTSGVRSDGKTKER